MEHSCIHRSIRTKGVRAQRGDNRHHRQHRDQTQTPESPQRRHVRQQTQCTADQDQHAICHINPPVYQTSQKLQARYRLQNAENIRLPAPEQYTAKRSFRRAPASPLARSAYRRISRHAISPLLRSCASNEEYTVHNNAKQREADPPPSSGYHFTISRYNSCATRIADSTFSSWNAPRFPIMLERRCL